MLNQHQVDAEEERLREIVRELSEEQRRLFYRDLKSELRDPDTYAALNWGLLVGLHHFYLKNWAHGLCDIAAFLVGILLIFTGYFWPGVALLLILAGWEIWTLFRAQMIVQDSNNRAYRRLLKRYQGASHAARQERVRAR